MISRLSILDERREGDMCAFRWKSAAAGDVAVSSVSLTLSLGRLGELINTRFWPIRRRDFMDQKFEGTPWAAEEARTSYHCTGRVGVDPIKQPDG